MTLPAAAQVGPLTPQSLFFQQASNARSGEHLAADAGLIYNDNGLYGVGGGGSLVALLGFSGYLSHFGTGLDYHLDANISATKYFSGGYSVEPTGYFDGEGTFKIVPGDFAWIGRETYTQLLIDPLAPATPNNLENLNFITTGPRFTLRPTLRTSVTLDGTYSIVTSGSPPRYIAGSPSAQYVNLDSHRYGADLKIERAFSSSASLYLKGSWQKVQFSDTTVNNDFTLGQGTAGYHLENGRTVLDVSGGYAQLRAYDVLVFEQSIIGVLESRQTQTIGEGIWALDLSRLIDPNQRVALTASQQLVDAATYFQQGFDSPVPTVVPPIFAAGNAFIVRSYGADWRVQEARTTLDVALRYVSYDYPFGASNLGSNGLPTTALPINNADAKVASALLARQLMPKLNWDIGAYFLHQDTFDAPAFSTTSEITNLRWQVGERLGLRFVYAHSSLSRGYTDNQFGVIVSYTLLGAGRGGQQGAAPGLSPLSPFSTQSPPQKQ
ncbi:MAG TPA: hypothetical protein VK822_10340 [Acetobacteraceae bacterium]|nr:hypothetical protein [Acetobacteraceae bacterium]